MKNFFVVAFAISIGSSAFAATSTEEIESLKKYCKADVQRLCPGVPLGDGGVKKCLKEHKKEISVGCAEALKKLKN